jgi:two-component system phosphate regulon sensor histidine kinase PhoR
MVKVETWQPEDSIAFYTHRELVAFNIFTDCKLTLYDAGKKQITFQKDLFAAASKSSSLRELPERISKPKFNSIILYFPHRERYILSNMIFWILSSIVLLGVLIWLGASLFFLNRQRSLNKLQRDFVNNFSHEFKTPLSVISLAAESLKKDSVLTKPERSMQYAEMVEYQTKYLQGQIERLLRYSLSEKTKLQLNKEPVNIHELITEAVNNLHPLVEQKKAAVHFGLNAQDPFVEGDKNYLSIVLINLIENALKYSTQPDVVIITGNQDHSLQLTVKDNGIGIEKKYHKEIFKRFFRIPNGDIRTSKGFGIGLSFVKKIIESHQGKIDVESSPGKGSEFVITLNKN